MMAGKKIILFGGTFDPIHLGHVEVCVAAMDRIGAQQVVFVPARRSPHKNCLPTASDPERIEMIRLAIQGRPRLQVSDCELKRPEPSYTLDTVQEFRRQYGSRADLIWLVGADAVKDLPRWYRIHELMEACTLAVMYRAGYPKPDFTCCKETFSARQIHKLENSVVPVPLIEISSTEIRDRISREQEVKEILAPEVYDYIQAHGLYR